MKQRRQRGIVLALVLVIGLLLSTAVFAFVRRATIDAHIAVNRDSAARAEALARGGIQIATYLLLTDADDEGDAGGNSHLAGWARAKDYVIDTEDGGQLRVEILDSGARLNLNAVLEARKATDDVGDETVEFLVEFFSKVIDELPGAPGQRNWDARELAHNLIDYVDENEEGLRGGSEDDWYQKQSPPYFPANEPLRSLDELGRVEGFSPLLLNGIRPYVTIHPRSGGTGINLNTAPAHVLATVYHGSQGSRRLASQDTVRRILKARADGRILCQDAAADDRCILTSEIVEGSIFPPAAGSAGSSVFTVIAHASVGDMTRSIEAVVDRGGPSKPRILGWRRR